MSSQPYPGPFSLFIPIYATFRAYFYGGNNLSTIPFLRIGERICLLKFFQIHPQYRWFSPI